MMGAEAIKKLLENVDLEAEYSDLKSQLNEATGQENKNN